MGKEQVFKQNLRRLMRESLLTLETLGLKANLDREGRKWLARIHENGLARASSATADKLATIAKCLNTEVGKFWESTVQFDRMPEGSAKLDYVFRIARRSNLRTSESLEFRFHLERVISGLYMDAQQVVPKCFASLAIEKLKASKDEHLKEILRRSGNEKVLSDVIQTGCHIARRDGKNIDDLDFELAWDEIVLPILEREYFPNEAQLKEKFTVLAIKGIRLTTEFLQNDESDDVADEIADDELRGRVDFEDLATAIRTMLDDVTIGKRSFQTVWSTVIVPGLKQWFESRNLVSIYDDILERTTHET